jgi:bacillithiol biosynthesis cysteine-adding enzyme BshC
MQKYTFHREQTGLFNQQSNWLAYDQEQLSDFISKPFNRNNLYEQARKKSDSFLPENREVLVTSLQDQYSTFPPNQFVNKQIQRLKDKNTVTIVTGHQPVVFGGPAYTMYKILHVIRLCEELNAEQQEIHFVPVFWLAGEDHDFEEMRSMKLFHSEIGLDEKLGGAFGRYPFAPIEELKEQVASFFQHSESNEIDDLLNNYKGATIVEATQSLFHYLFGDNGLIVLDPDRKELKHLFSPIMAEELRNQRAFNAMDADKDRFLASGLKAQAHPRAINLFYLGDYSRQRIEQVEADFFIEGKGGIQQPDLLEELKTHPERFSPNVILRPLYQEVLLPNVCYVGGVGELAYWLQLSPVFKAYDIVFPLIQPRCSIAIIEKRWEKKLSRSGLAMEDFFRPLERIKSERTEKAAADNFDFHPLNAANTQLREATEALFNGLDQNAVRNISKELHHCEEAIQRMIQSVLRSVKGKQEQELKDLDQLFQGVFPGGSMQERAVSFLQFCSDGKMKQRLNQIRDLIDPFDPDFIFVKE